MGMRLYNETQKTALGTSIKFKCRKLVFIWIRALFYPWDNFVTFPETLFPSGHSEDADHLPTALQ